jgi:maleylacetoacetate isomerase/maleylpyruvate isomerase
VYTLYTYWRSSTAYRARIALNLKGLAYTPVYVSLPRREHRAAGYLEVNPQGLVPALVDERGLTVQSLAIVEYLEETHLQPALLPADPHARAYVRALSQVVGCEMHPLNNVRVLRYLQDDLGLDEAARNRWYSRWVAEGFTAFEAMLTRFGLHGKYCFGDTPGLADVCLVPQVYNARRFNCPVADYPQLARIAAACEALPAFHAARPEAQADAVA